MAIGETKPLTIYETNTLWYIADLEYGNPFIWPVIWLYNKEHIRDPDFLRPGWKITIPLGLP